MKFSHGAALLLMLTAVTAPLSPARTRVAGFTGNARYDAATRQKVTPYGFLAIYPFAVFATGGRFIDETAGARSDPGVLVSGEFGLKLPRTRTSLEIGGWYWTKGDSDL